VALRKREKGKAIMIRQLIGRIIVPLVVIVCAIGAISQTPEVVLRSTEGRAIDLAESRGTVVVLYFGGTQVPMADRELPAFQRLADLYARRDVDFYWVCVDSTEGGNKRSFVSDADLQAFADELGLCLPVLRDPDRSAFRTFGLDVLPAIIILDREGQVFHKAVGFDPDYPTRSYSTVIRSLNQLLR
jgi:peroxiredoxin